MTVETALLGLIILLLLLLLAASGVIIYLLLQIQNADSTNQMEAAMSKSWLKLGLAEKIAHLTQYAADIRADYRALDQMLRVPTARGALGEMSLEELLQDQLEPSMVGIRKRLPNGLIPDAHIRSTVGIICIDSKFVLDNYRKMVTSDDEKEQARLKRAFLQNLRGHLDKIGQDYIRPDQGTAPFAFAYIPAEGVYWFLCTEALDLLRDYTKQGVQVVSPLTLSHKVALIKAGVFDQKLAEEARQIKAELTQIGRRFDLIDDEWRIFRQTHLGKLTKKADTIDQAYQQLRDDFEQIAER
ncbi:DNA recombination protein RmuC [Anaerolineales bacterium HSG25]|nr:DNA recombination protein RmuC [Anaerolineales bacterium HSG25]